MKVVINLTKGKGITEGPSLQKEPTSWKDGTDTFILLNLNDPFEQRQLNENLPKQLENINLQ